MISSVSLPSAFLGAYPDLDQHLGPVEHLRIQLPDGQSLPAVPSFPGWKFRGLKILDVHGPTYTFDGLLMSLTVLALQTQGGVTSVPILRLTTSVNDVNNRVPHIAGYIINGQMNPVVITNCVFDRPTIPIVRDPLNLWPLVRPWAETYIRANWNESVEPISPDQRQRTPSARLPHLVRYYQLAGLPAPTEHAEPILPVPPKRSVASKVRRWWRRRF